MQQTSAECARQALSCCRLICSSSGRSVVSEFSPSLAYLQRASSHNPAQSTIIADGAFASCRRRWSSATITSGSGCVEFYSTARAASSGGHHAPSPLLRPELLANQRRGLHASANPSKAQADGQQSTSGGADVTQRDDPYSSLSTKVTPVSAPEAASWSLVIIAAYAVTAALAYMVVSQLFMQTPEAAAFDAALARVREDFRVTVRMGEKIKGYGGVGGNNRQARHQISHRIYNDSQGTQHVQVQFNISGQGQRGVVSADMYKEGGEWRAAYLFVDIAGERIVLEAISRE